MITNVDVEMVELQASDVDGDGIRIDNKSTRGTNTIFRMQNLLTLGAMILCLMVGFFVGASLVRPIVPSVQSGLGDNNQDSIATTLDKQSSVEPHKTNGDEKIKKWLESKVTLEDGIKYEVVQQLKHDRSSFTEGLCYANGKLYESVGLWKNSALLVLDPNTGQTLERYLMDSKYFAEGLTYVNGKLIQLTYKHHHGFIYDANTLTSTPTTFNYTSTTGEGWGLTYDPNKNELIESDGSEFLHFWDPVMMTELRKVKVTRLDGSTANNINELEYWRGRVLANIWYTDILLVIHPETGIVEKEYDFSEIWAGDERRENGADVLNGISVSEDGDLLYITGKKWDRMFLIRLM